MMPGLGGRCDVPAAWQPEGLFKPLLAPGHRVTATVHHDSDGASESLRLSRRR